MSLPRRPADIPDALTLEEFWGMFGRIENEMLDFKRAVSKDIRETIPAMAMTLGGYIVHGVNRNLEIVGCPRSQKTVDRITRIAYECGVEVQVRPVAVAGVELTITAVPEVRGRIVTTPRWQAAAPGRRGFHAAPRRLARPVRAGAGRWPGR